MEQKQTEPQVVEVKDAPKNSTTFLLVDGRYVRVHLKLLTPDEQLATARDLEVETSAYEVNKAGDFIVDSNGEPVTMPKTRLRIPLGMVHSGEDSMKPGWVRRDLSYDPKNPRADVADVKQLKNLPKTGKPGDRVYLETDKSTYVYTEGLYDNVRRQQLGSFMRANPVEHSTPVDPAVVATFKP